MNLDKAISLYRRAANEHAVAKAEFVVANERVTVTQRALMLAKDELRAAEREMRDVTHNFSLA